MWLEYLSRIGVSLPAATRIHHLFISPFASTPFTLPFNAPVKHAALGLLIAKRIASRDQTDRFWFSVKDISIVPSTVTPHAHA